jgi:LPS export ABC transporter protein LptC
MSLSNIKAQVIDLFQKIDLKDKWVKIIAAVIILFVIFILFFTPKNDIAKVNALTKAVPPTEVATGVEVIYSDSAVIKAKLNTPKMIRYISNDPVMEMPNGLNVLFYDKAFNVNSKLRSNYGIRYVVKHLTILRGNVVVVNAKGDTMNTEELVWHEDKDKRVSDHFVKVKTKDEIILAQGFESDLNFTHYTFYKIKGTIKVKGGG